MPEPLDQCEEEIARTLASFFRGSGVRVIHGAHLNALLAEHSTSFTGIEDQAALMAVGRVLGPSALIDVRSSVCETRSDRSEQTRMDSRQVRTTTGRVTSGGRSTEEERQEEGETETTQSVSTIEVRVVDRVARTEATLALSIRVFDLTNDRVYGELPVSSSARLRENLTLEHPWGDAWPQTPSAKEAVSVAAGYVRDEVKRLLFGSSEVKTVYFYNNDKCGLKSAYRAVLVGSFERALDLSVQNLEICQREQGIKKRVLGNAHQNIGMAQALLGNHEEALMHLHEAAALRPGAIVREAISDVERAIEDREARRRFQERTETVREAWPTLAGRFEAGRFEPARAAAVPAAESGVLGNADIVDMVNAGLPEAVILARIESATTAFSLQTQDLKALDEAGVPASVIVAMIAAEGHR